MTEFRLASGLAKLLRSTDLAAALSESGRQLHGAIRELIDKEKIEGRIEGEEARQLGRKVLDLLKVFQDQYGVAGTDDFIDHEDIKDAVDLIALEKRRKT